MWFLENAWLVPAIPAASFVVILLFGRRLPKGGSEVGIAALGAAWLLACGAVVQWIQRVDDAGGAEHAGGIVGLVSGFGRSMVFAEDGHASAVVEPVTRGFTWWQNGSVHFGVGIQIDGLAVLMMFVVTTISLLVHIYSTEYIRGDRRFTYFYAALSLFTASMLLLVVADNTLQLLVGWELVGVCSFMLIGHWWEERENSKAALKAFLTTRTGDVGLLIGVIVLFFGAGTFNIVETNLGALDGSISHTVLVVGSICLLIGVIGKSGQFPLHTWLPDAMAGPTPVSALIHAATMVVAGIYLVARLYGVFWEGMNIEGGGINLMAAVGGITIVIGALLAFVQRDIKKVLAYSTISQLGYMVMALGVGGWLAAIFHLFTHAFFKALLFLGAGSVSHSGSHHSFDMKSEMGGLRKYMPQTFITFLIGTGALMGLPLLSGFFSKDEIIATAGHNSYVVFMIVGLAGAFLTAAYMTRCVYLTFFGEYRGEHHPHESPPSITVPLWILAVFAILAGYLQAVPLNIEKFQEWFEPRVAFPLVEHPDFEYALAGLATLMGLLGIGLCLAYYKRGVFQGLTERFRLARVGYVFLENKYYLDALYEGIIVKGIREPIARAAYWINQNVIDRVPNELGRGAQKTGRFVYEVVDQRIVDTVVNGTGTAAEGAGSELRTMQTGRVQSYGAVLFGAAALLAIVIVVVTTTI